MQIPSFQFLIFRNSVAIGNHPELGYLFVFTQCKQCLQSTATRISFLEISINGEGQLCQKVEESVFTLPSGPKLGKQSARTFAAPHRLYVLLQLSRHFEGSMA